MTIKINFPNHNEMSNIETTKVELNRLNRLPFIVIKLLPNYIVPADIQFIQLFRF